MVHFRLKETFFTIKRATVFIANLQPVQVSQIVSIREEKKMELLNYYSLFFPKSVYLWFMWSFSVLKENYSVG